MSGDLPYLSHIYLLSLTTSLFTGISDFNSDGIISPTEPMRSSLYRRLLGCTPGSVCAGWEKLLPEVNFTGGAVANALSLQGPRLLLQKCHQTIPCMSYSTPRTFWGLISSGLRRWHWSALVRSGLSVGLNFSAFGGFTDLLLRLGEVSTSLPREGMSIFTMHPLLSCARVGSSWLNKACCGNHICEIDKWSVSSMYVAGSVVIKYLVCNDIINGCWCCRIAELLMG